MGQHDDRHGEPTTTSDFEQLADAVDEARESVRALVAGFEVDGFTPREARALTAGIFASQITNHEGEAGA